MYALAVCQISNAGNLATLSPATKESLKSILNTTVFTTHKDDRISSSSTVVKQKTKPFSSGGILPPQPFLVGKSLSEKAREYILAQPTGIRPVELDSISCDHIHLHDIRGTIRSPRYPSNFNNYTSCTWYIVGGPKDIITIR